MSRDNRALAAPSFAIAKGGGRRLTSCGWLTLMLEAVDAMLDADRFLLWPLLCPPWLPRVLALDRLPGGRTRSVRICL